MEVRKHGAAQKSALHFIIVLHLICLDTDLAGVALLPAGCGRWAAVSGDNFLLQLPLHFSQVYKGSKMRHTSQQLKRKYKSHNSIGKRYKAHKGIDETKDGSSPLHSCISIIIQVCISFSILQGP